MDVLEDHTYTSYEGQRWLIINPNQRALGERDSPYPEMADHVLARWLETMVLALFFFRVRRQPGKRGRQVEADGRLTRVRTGRPYFDVLHLDACMQDQQGRAVKARYGQKPYHNF